MRIDLKGVAIACVVVVTCPAAAQTSGDALSTLARTVVETHPRIQAQRAAVAALEARVDAARGGWLPAIQADGLSQRRRLTIHGGPGDQTFTAAEASVSARQPLFDGFRTPNAVASARAELESGRAVLAAVVEDVLLELVAATADVRRDQMVANYARQQYDAIADQLRGTSRRLDLGEATRTDESQARARLATSEAGLLAASEELATSASGFEAVSGTPAATNPELPPLPPLPANLEEARTAARSASPSLRAAQDTAEAARRAVGVARGSLLPAVDLVAGYEYLAGGVANLFTGRLPNDRSALFGGVELRVPIFQQGREYAEIARTKAVSAQRLAQVSQTERDVTRDIETAWARWQSANATIAAARTAVAANEQAAEGVRRESISGNRTLLDVLDAQNELLASRTALERAVRNEYVARATILAVLGRLSTIARP